MGLKDIVNGLNTQEMQDAVNTLRAVGRMDLVQYLQQIMRMGEEVNPIVVEITASRVVDMLTAFQQQGKVDAFSLAINTFMQSQKTGADFAALFKIFERCCQIWTWDEILFQIDQTLKAASEPAPQQ